MNTQYRFHQLDVFSNKPLLGNPLAVVHAATDISDDTMARFARWTNLSETTFLLPPQHPEADYRVRIFTPGGELPFAGHPALQRQGRVFVEKIGDDIWIGGEVVMCINGSVTL